MVVVATTLCFKNYFVHLLFRDYIQMVVNHFLVKFKCGGGMLILWPFLISIIILGNIS